MANMASMLSGEEPPARQLASAASAVRHDEG